MKNLVLALLLSALSAFGQATGGGGGVPGAPGSSAPTGPAGGVLTGTYPNPSGLAAATVAPISQRTDYSATLTTDIPLVPDGEKPSIAAAVLMNNYQDIEEAHNSTMVSAIHGCSGSITGGTSTNGSTGCLFRYPLNNMYQVGSTGLAAFAYGTGYQTQYGPVSCYTTTTSNNNGMPYAIDFITSAAGFSILQKASGGLFTMQVDGAWTDPYFNYALPNQGGLLYETKVVFPDARPRRIRLLVNDYFQFVGLSSPNGASDITTPTSSNWPQPAFDYIAVSDSTGAGVIEEGNMPWPIRLWMISGVPTVNSSCGGTGFVNTGISPNVALTSRYSNDLITVAGTLGVTKGVILYGDGINDSGLSSGTVQAAANTVFAAVASGLTGWVQDFIGPWSPSTPVSSNLLSTQAAIVTAGNANGVYQTSDPIAENWITGTPEPSATACPAVALPASNSRGNACQFLNPITGSPNGPHPAQSGADYAAYRIYNDLSNASTGFPQFTATPNLLAQPLGNSASNVVTQVYADPFCDLRQGGTISVSGTAVTGSGTTFTKCLQTGWSIYGVGSGSDLCVISTISSDTSLTCTASLASQSAIQYVGTAPHLIYTLYANGDVVTAQGASGNAGLSANTFTGVQTAPQFFLARGLTQHQYFEDYYTLAAVSFVSIGSASGQSCALDDTYNTTTNHPGNIRIRAGTGGTGTGEACGLANVVATNFQMNTATPWTWDTFVYVPVLPGTTVGAFQSGMAHTVAANPWTTGIGFYLSSANGTPNDWYCEYSSTYTDSGIAATVAWTELSTYNDGTNTHWYVNGVEATGCAVASTSLPSTSQVLASTSAALSATSVDLEVDYTLLQK